MQEINPNTVWISSTKRYIYINLFEDNLLASFEEVFQLYLKVKIIFNFRRGLPVATELSNALTPHHSVSPVSTRSMIDSCNVT